MVQYGDRTSTLKYFDVASRTPGAPDNITKIAANFGSAKTKREESRTIWQGIYDSSKDEVVQERAKAYLDHYDLLDLLEKAAAVYQKAFGKYPADQADLVKVGILPDGINDPFGFTFKFDENGNAQIK